MFNTNSKKKWSNLVQTIIKFKNKFYSNHVNVFIHMNVPVLQNFFMFKGLIYSVEQFEADCKVSKKIYTQPVLFLHSRLIFIYSTNLCFYFSKTFLYRSQPYWHFFPFSSSERFLYLLQAYQAFYFFLLQKDFGSFHKSFMKVFF